MEKLIQEIKSKALNENRFVIAIDGPAASGKSTLAKELSSQLDATLIHLDDYFLPKDRKTIERLNESGGNIDYERFLSEILSHIKNKKLSYQKFNCMTMELEESSLIHLKKIVIIEGVYSLHKNFRDFIDYKILLSIDKTTQLDRLQSRNPNLYIKFITEWLPLEANYFNTERLEEIVDYII